ncbi:MAG: hypothetical protein A2V70_07435 [Planctomycetes bacterium RBG_13_63_9]|nr:MAG: hypothetical protein A2V70_07435 [Planctomycetes bacterium RBG_13_63_9]
MDDPAVTKEADSLARRVLLPDGAEAARLIVCEHGGGWAVGLRRELAGEEVHLCETRSLAQCWETLGENPAGLVVVELTTANVDELLGRMVRLGRDFPLARVAIVADRRLAGYEWLMREAGAVHFVCSPRQLGPLAEVARRHLDQAPVPRRSVTERIWASLPWGSR